ncbi:MAG: sugar transferase, partial [Verrucomicrobia bacterium]|nr:sugar transferase [Verrucomicrobiota bacterium]
MLRNQRQIQTSINKVLDGLVFAISLWLAHELRSVLHFEVFGGTADIAPFEGAYVWISALLLFVAPFVLDTQGFYSRSAWPSHAQTVWPLLKASVLITLLIITVMFAFKIQLTRSVILIFAVLSIALVWAKEEGSLRWQRRRLTSADSQTRIILLGSPEQTQNMLGRIDDTNDTSYRVVLKFNIDLEPIDDLLRQMHDHSANVVLINAGHTKFDKIEQVINACELEGVEVWLAADFFNTQIARTAVDDFHGVPLLVFHSAPTASLQGLAKQAIDFAGALAMLVLLSPVLLLCALLVKITSPGPILFRQKRSGINGRPFTMYKFRSMGTNAEQRKHELAAMNEMGGPVFKVANDPRITPIGRFLRRFSLDELPQLFNVL